MKINKFLNDRFLEINPKLIKYNTTEGASWSVQKRISRMVPSVIYFDCEFKKGDRLLLRTGYKYSKFYYRDLNEELKEIPKGVYICYVRHYYDNHVFLEVPKLKDQKHFICIDLTYGNAIDVCFFPDDIKNFLKDIEFIDIREEGV